MANSQSPRNALVSTAAAPAQSKETVLDAAIPAEVVETSSWAVEVASSSVEASSEASNEATPWATVVQKTLSPAYLDSLMQVLRSGSSLPELVAAQLFQHLLKVYKDKVEAVVQERGIDAIDTNQPHFKVITNRKQGTKRLELTFDNERIKSYLNNSLAEFFTHAGIWKEFAKVVGTNLVIGVIEALEESSADSSLQTLSDKDLSQTVSDRLHQIEPSFLLERAEVLGQIHCQDISKKILEGFNLPTCTLQDLEKLLGLKQRPPASTETNLDFDPIAVLPTSIPIASS
ncbi:MAG: hypothetical protein ACP5RH_16665, partial [Leptodesmis sp.]